MFLMGMAVKMVGFLVSVYINLSNPAQKSLSPNAHGLLVKYLGNSPKSAGAVLLLRKAVEAIQVPLHEPSLGGRTV